MLTPTPPGRGRQSQQAVDDDDIGGCWVPGRSLAESHVS